MFFEFKIHQIIYHKIQFLLNIFYLNSGCGVSNREFSFQNRLIKIDERCKNNSLRKISYLRILSYQKALTIYFKAKKHIIDEIKI